MENSAELTPDNGIPPITFVQTRVLGCLIEKEITTPENYPLTLNSLVLACNQTSNREPIVSFSEDVVREALEELKPRGFVFQVSIPGARVQKFKHNLGGKFPRLEKAGISLMAVLLLRGVQTAGELRQRTERLHGFVDLRHLEAALQNLIDYPEFPLVALLPAGAGRKAPAYAHLLCGPISPTAPLEIAQVPARSTVSDTWRERIEQELAALRHEVSELRALVAKLEVPGTDQQETPTGMEGTYIP
ncbi:MAG: YceH family protein [Roseimicrobium sp.]